VLSLLDQVASTHATKAVEDFKKAQVRGGAEWERRNADYQAAALKDPDLGNGDPKKLEAAKTLGTRALATWFPREVIDAIAEAGLESHPGLVKGLVKIGKAMKEDDFVVAPASTPSDKKRLADTLYPSTAAKAS
jgi:hypothetical protein